jgi:hypothetical protein
MPDGNTLMSHIFAGTIDQGRWSGHRWSEGVEGDMCLVTFHYIEGGRPGELRWHVDPRTREAVPLDDITRQLSAYQGRYTYKP